jgi:hypothetical protein
MYRCARCGKEIVLSGVMRGSICPHCRAYLHSCVNCKFYSPGRHNDCSEPQAETVRDKRTANFCDFFVFRDSASHNIGQAQKKKDDARKRFDSLFGD